MARKIDRGLVRHQGLYLRTPANGLIVIRFYIEGYLLWQLAIAGYRVVSSIVAVTFSVEAGYVTATKASSVPMPKKKKAIITEPRQLSVDYGLL